MKRNHRQAQCTACKRHYFRPTDATSSTCPRCGYVVHHYNTHVGLCECSRPLDGEPAVLGCRRCQQLQAARETCPVTGIRANHYESLLSAAKQDIQAYKERRNVLAK